MAEVSKIRRCYSCGAILQSDDPYKDGYVKKETLDNASQNFLFCDKCFELERYKKVDNEPPLEPEVLKIVQKGKEMNCLFIYIVNLFSFEAAFNKELDNLLKDANVLVVATKFDLLPKGSKKELISEYVAHRFRDAGLHIKASDVMLASYLDNDSIKDILTRIYEHKNGKNVYFIGSKLSGRSTLLSSFLRIYNNLSHGNIVTENYPGTSVNVTKIPLNNKTAIYFLPGLGLENSFLYDLDKTTLREIYLTKAVKPREISLSKNQCLFIGGLSFVELVEGNRTTFAAYFHDNIALKKTHLSSKNIDERFVKLVTNKALKPSLNRIKSVKDLDVYEMNITEDGQRDIGILGLGWLSFMGNGQKFRLYVPRGVAIYHSRAKIIK